MKFVIICLALCLHQAVVHAGECFDGSSRDGVGNMTVVTCDFPEESCATKIELNHGVTILTRGCLQTKACSSNIANNQQQCYSEIAIENEVQLCYFCCNNVDLCNNFVAIPPASGEPPIATLPGLAATLPIDFVTLPTDAVTLPTDAVTLPTDAVTLPTDAVTLPTDAVTLPTDAVTLPTEAVTLPTDAVTLPTDAVTLPTDAVTLPTEAVTLPTDAVTLPTDAVTLPTDL
uniref:ZAN protein precursor n=1 Tax=Ciona intestinalis TaxID=7719 RepID=UPI000180CB16|nr:ZAN protein precursor [Ciona intestinalis]|eukprot:XP_009858100.1 uncharacterized protein LOC100175385 [Ciona intestinalis]